MILTSKRRAEHPFAGQNTQKTYLTLDGQENYFNGLEKMEKILSLS